MSTENNSDAFCERPLECGMSMAFKKALIWRSPASANSTFFSESEWKILAVASCAGFQAFAAFHGLGSFIIFGFGIGLSDAKCLGAGKRIGRRLGPDEGDSVHPLILSPCPTRHTDRRAAAMASSFQRPRAFWGFDSTRKTHQNE